MKVRSLLFLFILLSPFIAIAQKGGYGHGRERTTNYTENGSALTVFSVNGDQFFLMINGIKQNTYPQTKVRVEELPQVTNDIQIIFNDNRTQSIQRTVTFANPVDSRAIDLVLKIERMQGGPMLSFHKSSQLMRDYRPEQGEYVMHYCREVVPPPVVRNVPPPPPPPAHRAMDDRTFADAKQSISSASFESTKLSTAKTILTSNFICVDQVMAICRLFSFDDSKLEFAKYAYSKTVDENNYFKVGNVFSFSSSKEDLNNFISKQGVR